MKTRLTNLALALIIVSFPYQVASRMKGEASFAIPEMACTVKNRLDAGWVRHRVLEHYYAPDVEPTAAEVETVRQVLAGEIPCDNRLYFALGSGDTWRPHEDAPVLTLCGAHGLCTRFYTRFARDNGLQTTPRRLPGRVADAGEQ